MTTTTVMYPHITRTTILHQNGGLDGEYSGGLYNTTCDPFNPRCVSRLNLVCVESHCTCISNYKPIADGGCVEDGAKLIRMWSVRVVITAIIFFSFLILLHLILYRRRRWCNLSTEDGSVNEVDEERGASYWYDSSPPPNYQDVTDSDPPPPSYQDAVTKIMVPELCSKQSDTR
ncbi:hypothetical protein Pmani_023020 [Petrolisthes manimaculis]|uniref:Uncharacterized protein n=1 Tax=Petrolisthes manimaculis TaxID=1843537 RepID=A0AAE1U1J1_9EUCA|nr:hypothetical protein Pmani_023020 [Petrolisthes manimaculis]